MSCKPSAGTKPGTLHTLQDRVSRKQEVFEWTGKSWSTPGTGWGTKWSLMDALGWRYVGPVTDGVQAVRTDHIRSVPGGAAFLRVAASERIPCSRCTSEVWCEMHGCKRTPGVKACGSHQCIAAQRDGVLCADGECDRENGVRPDGVAVVQPEQDTRKPWERTDWNCALARVDHEGLHCPDTGRCADCPNGVAPSGEPLRHATKENGDCPHWCKACAAEEAARGVSEPGHHTFPQETPAVPREGEAT